MKWEPQNRIHVSAAVGHNPSHPQIPSLKKKMQSSPSHTSHGNNRQVSEQYVALLLCLV